ncbi:hypothetical protein HPB51_005726 [Rhipicephalus microplus]|uniref:Uncharacterized protein n=1 Tax=Rhipicephalus microplus TaxID=6941 RepID=A0A9J6EYU9_RHIMP|nr:hypothetical protein HPB51_005726 [Rhipicephalus microplus]
MPSPIRGCLSAALEFAQLNSPAASHPPAAPPSPAASSCLLGKRCTALTWTSSPERVHSTRLPIGSTNIQKTKSESSSRDRIATHRQRGENKPRFESGPQSNAPQSEPRREWRRTYPIELLHRHDGQCNEKATRRRAESTRSTVLRTKGRAHPRIIRNNITRQALVLTDSTTKDQAAYEDDRQAHLETLSANNARLCAELSSLRTQLNRATTRERETLHEVHQNASQRKERVTTPMLGLNHSVPADITMSSGSTRPPSPNNGTNQDAARPAMPTVSMHEGEPSVAQILVALVNTEALLANRLSRGPPTTSPIQIHSTSDTSSSILLFDGTPQQSAHEWITQVERIAALAHWTPSLTLVTAASRLTGSAKDSHSAYGSHYETWERWKEALILPFKRKLT